MNKNYNESKTMSPTVVTAGSNYLDIDAYACCVSMQELLALQGNNIIAYSDTVINYSVCRSLIAKKQLLTTLLDNVKSSARYIIVDVSDPEYLEKNIPLQNVVAVYDHHAGFEDYWKNRIGENAHIEFIGAAATLIYHEWEKVGLQDKMSRSSAMLLVAAILDNTLNLTSSNTTKKDIEVYNKLCTKEGLSEEWRASYFSEVQENIEADLKNALLNDTKTICNNIVLPSKIVQLTVWNSERILKRLPEIRHWFDGDDSYMINIIDIQRGCSYFVCDNMEHQQRIGQVFNVQFEAGVAMTAIPYLRKEIIKMTQNSY